MKIKYKSAIKYLYIVTLIVNLVFFAYITNIMYSLVYLPISNKKAVIVDPNSIKIQNINSKKLDEVVDYILNKK